MKKLVRSNPVLSFIFFTLLYSWTLWLLMILSARGLLPFKFPTNFLGSFGPAAGAVVVTAFVSGKPGLKALARSLAAWKSSPQTWAFAVFFILIVYGLTIAVQNFTDPSVIKFEKLPGAGELLLWFFVIAIVGGPLGEEPGWRGFLLPELAKRFSPAVASLIVAAIWLLWHIPLFWLEGAAQEGGSILYFALSVLSMSFLFTLLWLKSGGSLLLAVVFHTMINYVSAYIIPSVLPAAEKSKAFGHLSTWILCALALITFAVCFRAFTKPADNTRV